MKQLNNILFVIILLLFAPSCKDGQTVGVDPEPETPIYELPADVPTKGMTIVLPSGSSADLSSYTVFSQSFTVKPGADGSVEVPYSKDNYNIAWVFDQSHNVVLAGFVTDSDTTLSVATTAEVLLYISMGVTFAPAEVKKTFVSDIGTIEGVAEWKAELESIFIADPLMLNKGLFVEPLKAVLTSLKGKAPAILADKPGDILVNAADIRSGLQLAEDGLSEFTITNTFRRRAYAFLYKKSYKDMGGETHIVESEISGKDAPISATKIAPTKAIRDWKGVLQDWVSAWAADKPLEFASTTTDPAIEIPFEDNESRAKFKIRVVGPGIPSGLPFTDQENEKWQTLVLQTVLFDYILPIILDAVGHNEILGQMNSNLALGKNLEGLQTMVNKTKLLIGAIPAASDALESGDYKKVVTEVLSSMVNGRVGDAAGEWMKFLYESIGNYVYKNGSNHYDDASVFDDRLENLTKVLEIVDLGMKLVDYLRISGAIAGSITLEPWDLTVREVEINLEPHEFSVGLNEKKKLTAYIKTDLGKDHPVIEYHWETTGKYGTLMDDRGHEGNKFTSSLKEVYYQANASAEETPTENKTDIITVGIYLKTGQNSVTKVGIDTAVATINESFTVALEPHVNIKELTDHSGKTFWRWNNPYFTAEFAERPEAKSYTIASIKKDGSILKGRTHTPDQLDISNGIVHYVRAIGGIVFGETYSKARMEQEKARQEKMLADYVVSAIRVTVNF